MKKAACREKFFPLIDVKMQNCFQRGEKSSILVVCSLINNESPSPDS